MAAGGLGSFSEAHREGGVLDPVRLSGRVSRVGLGSRAVGASVVRASQPMMVVCLAGGWPSTTGKACTTLLLTRGQGGCKTCVGNVGDIYCDAAAVVGFPTCPDGDGYATHGEMVQAYQEKKVPLLAELPMLMGICAAHDKCTGIYDHKDDGGGLRLCQGEPYSRSNARYWPMSTGADPTADACPMPACPSTLLCLAQNARCGVGESICHTRRARSEWRFWCYDRQGRPGQQQL